MVDTIHILPITVGGVPRTLTDKLRLKQYWFNIAPVLESLFQNF